ncbi:Glycosyltransferase involved in cell wall bisynthesis [Microbacterium sp. ru370.1]|uniref:glycosyltransferase n=1 Tax=unclassified Microbacterium TaxID=2609290 RepID=UPI000888119B|nr:MULTISPECIES: glycosyltransferase [unclassified Microbacterium]SDO47980.1 Glycosyltransferase involved in cell wall bisynthesis [Microbacterium sp. ru370.1]SIT82298.1 Glycosyltransferase involved in cell wall bisynthesis [Microbacterium sp. RU1D]
MSDAEFPDAWYLILSSRLIPDLDGGYTISTLARARQMADAGATPLLLTVDPGDADAHAAHRRTFVERGAAAASGVFRNLFDEAVAPDGGAAPWLRGAVHEGRPDPALEYRDVAGGAVSLPNVMDPDWHLSAAPIVVRDAAGEPVGVIDGFGALYRAWLAHVATQLREEERRPVVIICESRQLGELIVGWGDDDVRILHTVHTIHLDAPYRPDSALNALWTRWFEIAPRFDAVLWPTAQQRDDVRERFGGSANDLVAPHAVRGPAEVVPAGDRDAGRVVVLGRLAPGKRLPAAVRAFARVVTEVPAARLELWGAGAQRDELETLVAELGLADAVILPGLTNDAGAVLDRAAAYLTTSAFEGQGLALAEALAHGTPVVAYDIRYGPRDMLAAGGGILVPDGDEDALVSALVRVLTDAETRERLSSQAVHAAATLSPVRAMRTLAAACSDALARPRRR